MRLVAKMAFPPHPPRGVSCRCGWRTHAIPVARSRRRHHRAPSAKQRSMGRGAGGVQSAQSTGPPAGARHRRPAAARPAGTRHRATTRPARRGSRKRRCAASADAPGRAGTAPRPLSKGGAAAALEEATGNKGVVSTRFTHVYPDGPAVYYTFSVKGDADRLVEQWRRIKTRASEALMQARGTITHHHAVGRDHMPWYVQQRPALFGAALAAAKRALDPAGVMNPGVLVA